MADQAPDPLPFQSPSPPWVRFDIPEGDPFLHRVRSVQFVSLWRSGLPLASIIRARLEQLRLRAALARATGTWRYRVRVVRWLRGDVGFQTAAPLRAVTDHARRLVLFDFDALTYAPDLRRDPAVRDEAGHIRERRGLTGRGERA